MAAEVPATLQLEVVAMGGDADTPPFEPASFRITVPNQSGSTDVETDGMEVEGGSQCVGVSSTLCSTTVPLTIADGLNDFRISVENGPVDRLPVFSGDCRGALGTDRAEAGIAVLVTETRTCRVTFVEADDTVAGADAVVVLETTFDLGQAPGDPFLLDVVRDGSQTVLVATDVRDMRVTSPGGAGDCVPLGDERVVCEWIAAFAAPLTDPRTVLLEETVPSGWLPVYGGDCDIAGALPALLRHELVHCSIENVRVETGATDPDRVLTIELEGSAATPDPIRVRVYDETGPSAPLLAELDSDHMTDATGSACDPLPAGSPCRGDIGIDGGTTPIDLFVRVEGPPSVTGTTFSLDCTPGSDGTYGRVTVARQARMTCRLDVDVEPDVVDGTPPVVVGVPDRAPNGAGWYDAPVTIDWQASDDSGFATDPANTAASTEGQGVVYTSDPSCDAAGNCATGSLVLSIDQTDPTVTCAAAPSFALNEAGLVTAAVSDVHSGPVSDVASAAADTATPGPKTVALTGTDHAGNTATTSCPYTVGFVFEGFSSPVDNGGVLNVVKAGRAIPLKWRLLDGSGAPVTDLATATITVQTLQCAAGTTSDEVEETVAGGSSLQNLGDGYYQLNWKSPTSYVNSCKTLRLELGEDGLVHTALFQFKK